ncbi:MAG: 50S ribosomal protein L18 [Candidatus Babeliaceae bacterium]|jgi:large subunit ribosomal protein L18
MSVQRKIKKRAERRVLRVRNRFDGRLPRVSVFRSLNHIYAQVIDDNLHKTIVSCSSLELENVLSAKDKTSKARAVGLELALRALKNGVNVVAFDRGNKLYHGRIKSLAEGLKEGGITI